MSRRTLCIISLACAGWLLAALRVAPAGAQGAPGDWREEFEAVCVKTDIAMSLSSEELTQLLARCDQLAERIGAEGEIVRKVYLKRLQSCRALFAYVLETRAAAGGGAAQAPPPQDAPAQTAPPQDAPPQVAPPQTPSSP